jgi:CHAT domain-containing protein
VGDPIYNTADPRWQGAKSRLGDAVSAWFAPSGADRAAPQLSRLVASASEIDSSAHGWSSGSGTAVVLVGSDARREKFLSLTAGGPSVIHLATHVVTSRVTPRGTSHERGEQAFIAFGLGESFETEFLTTSGVAQLHVPGALVVMTGCSTAEGEARAGTGLLGLTRAWLLAGAGAVLATGWPVKDSTGEIFTSFYGYLRNAPAAEALRRSQIEMIRSSTWRAAPEYWASYQVTGGAH